ncbi:MAG: ABC transporter ATP-binding protein [Candidatus Moranbacteria bacterium]|nr:ABC transporter ATP-binding protein [Candidatus Moranbacteria bacterium]
MDKDIAISVKNVSKTFRIPHEKVSSIRGVFTSAFNGKRTFEEFKALDDVSFEVKKGEFFGIIGRNGSGKSTLLKVLAGIYQADKVYHVGSKDPTVGSVTVNGMISPFLELGIGFNPELSGRDNVYLNATVLGMTKKQIDEKFDSIVEFSELGRFIDQKLKNYSSGMQVRLAFSVSIHANRDILLMDEVLAVGDSNFQSKCLNEFIKYKEMGKTVILVTHDIATVQRYCDRAMLLRSGRIRMIDTAEKVSNAYVYENIEDEEQRLDSEVTFLEVGDEMERQKPARITRVQYLDFEKKDRKVFRTGDDMVVRIFFSAQEQIQAMNFGIAVYSLEGDYMFGVNTLSRKTKTKIARERGYFEIEYVNVPLRTGFYYVKAGIWGKTEVEQYDFLDKGDAFEFISNDNNQGMINVEYQIH